MFGLGSYISRSTGALVATASTDHGGSRAHGDYGPSGPGNYQHRGFYGRRPGYGSPWNRGWRAGWRRGGFFGRPFGRPNFPPFGRSMFAPFSGWSPFGWWR